MRADQCVQAVFGTTLSTTVAGNGSIALYPSGPLYPYGTIARMAAVPQPSNYFVLWGNSASGNANPLDYLVSAPNQTVSSLFGALPTNRFTLTALQAGLGTISVSPQTNLYTNGQLATIIATPGPDQVFLGWTGDVNGAQTRLVLTMNQSKSVFASFSRRAHLGQPSCWVQVRDEGFGLTLSGEFGVAYRIEGSTNLMDWFSVATVTNSFGITEFTDPTATNGMRQFYRALVEQ
jgi:hypothetical protein